MPTFVVVPESNTRCRFPHNCRPASSQRFSVIAFSAIHALIAATCSDAGRRVAVHQHTSRGRGRARANPFGYHCTDTMTARRPGPTAGASLTRAPPVRKNRFGSFLMRASIPTPIAAPRPPVIKGAQRRMQRLVLRNQRTPYQVRSLLPQSPTPSPRLRRMRARSALRWRDYRGDDRS